MLEFSFSPEEELIGLHRDLEIGKYQHSQYSHFTVADPKPRNIHKASVRDRVLHHAIHRILYPIFDSRFIFDAYSSRERKGTHAAIQRFEKLAWRLSCNRTKTVWVLQCDVQKFFASVDHSILSKILARTVHDEQVLSLLTHIIDSFHVYPGKGIPLGNLTSQLFANVYMDPLDQYMKRVIRVPVYIRYADDILLAHTDKALLLQWQKKLEHFLQDELKLHIHPYKTTLRKWHQGIDFLGYVSFPTHRVVRTRTRKRLLRRISTNNAPSYFGITQHAKSFQLQKKMRDILDL